MLVLGIVFTTPTLAVPVFAEMVQAAVVDAGNKLCPVSGDPVSGNDFVIYQGKRYGLCCAACEKIFLRDPAKYIARLKTGQTMALTAPVTADTSASNEMEKSMEQGSL